MKYRKLRIAWSVGCGVLCLLLIVLCLQSYWVRHEIGCYLPVPYFAGMQSNSGQVSARVARTNQRPTEVITHSGYPSQPESLWIFDVFVLPRTNQYFLDIAVPHWFCCILSALAAALPWLRWSFSLRTLLIATTLVAVALGAIIWSVR